MPRSSDAEFQEVFHRLFPSATALARRITRDGALAEDLAAEAMTRLYARWYWLGSRSHREAWVLRVTTNLAIDAVRRQRKPAPEGQAATADQLHLVADRLELVEALRRLPRRQREVVALRYLGDLPESEVARLLGIATGSVKTHLHRGLAGLRSALATPDEWEARHAD